MLFQDYIQNDLGYWSVSSTESGISRIAFSSESFGRPANPNEMTQRAVVQLSEYFAGERQVFDLDLDLSAGTDFQQRVWQLVADVPYGNTESYGQIAYLLGDANASRAVGLANGLNPIPIIIPCHRVIGKNGKLTGYASGLELKKALLKIENPRRWTEPKTLF